MNRILLIEDDQDLALGLVFNLRHGGFEVVHCSDGEAGLAAFAESPFSLVLLDWMLPGMDGMEVLNRIRQQSERVLILLLTARDLPEDVVEGLDRGADDYLAKPFDLNVLLARIRSLLRSRQTPSPASSAGSEARFGEFHLNFDTFEGVQKDKPFKLSYKEAMVMKLFWEKRGQIVTREELLQKVWGIEGYVQSRSVDNYIVQLRKRFERDPKNPRLILSVHGSGYKFVPSL